MNDAAPAVESAPVETAPSARESITAAPETPSFAVPEAYADRGWAANLQSQDDLYKQFDNLQGMMGKKSLPTAESSDADWDAHYEQMRPANASEYEFALPEGMEAEVNEEVQGKYKEGFHKLGLTPKQAQGIHDLHMGLEMEKAGEQQTPEQLDAEFDEKLGKMYGDKANDAIKTAHTYIATLDAESRDSFADLPNDQMIAVVKLLNDTHAKFSREDGAPDGTPSTQARETTDAKVSRANELRMSDAARDPFHKDHKATRAEIAELDLDIQRLLK